MNPPPPLKNPASATAMPGIVQSRPFFIPAALGIAGKKRVQYNLHAHAHNQLIKSAIQFLEPAIFAGQWSITQMYESSLRQRFNRSWISFG